MMRRAALGPWWRALCGRRAWLAVPVGALVAAVLALDPVLGPEDGLGAYLAYCSLLPVALLFRLGSEVDARRRDGLEFEEQLRDRSRARAPAAAALAATAALVAGLAICSLPPLLLGLAAATPSPPALHPLHIAADGAGGWNFDAGGAVPDGAALLLAFRWERLPAPGAGMIGADGAALPMAAGELVRSPLAADEARAGRCARTLNDSALASGATLIRPLVRLAVPRPHLTAAPRLLARQALFFAPLFGLVLLLARRGGTGGALAALAALAVAGLAAFDPFEPPRLGGGPADLVARAVLAFRAGLPDVRGLAAVGRGFELRSGTTAASMTLLWWGLGGAALALTCWPRRRRP
jgi:hypothetical protein